LAVCSAIFVVVFTAAGAACGAAPTGDFVLGNGEIRFDDINKILSNSFTTEEEKREQLRGLGIEDDSLIDALIRNAAG